ncbi:MAG: hypothetical protein HZB20_00215 [Chloroflexi bacterium]|nr:hypothetical protein [Chloroflexota bacterium]
MKVGGASAGGLLLGAGTQEARAYKGEGVAPYQLHKKVGGVTTICPYCAVGCGQLVAVENGRAVGIEGDPEHPISRGSLCSKGAASLQLVHNSQRVTGVLYRTLRHRHEPPRGRRLHSEVVRVIRIQVGMCETNPSGA